MKLKCSYVGRLFFTNELERLRAHNLIKGGDLSNALVIWEKGMTQEKMDNLTSKFD
ncbi:MAG: UDP-3-O-acyl-N-acetylglucosamine deacetylase [Saprospiraceae bacterium]|nr:UDP-3-O-acyl-N-acetylglucosamine deacetylase [Saprospiraceae bacterium]